MINSSRTPLFLTVLTTAALIATPVLADSNATLQSETVNLGAGPFNHAAAVGDAGNTIVSGVTFTGGFNATHVRFAGTLTSIVEVVPPTLPNWGSEADIQIRRSGSSFNWQNPLPSTAFTVENYDTSREITGPLAGVDPGVTAWDVEFYDSFSDGAPGVDSESSNVAMTFSAFDDSNGVFALGALSGGYMASSVGELALGNLYDLYSITLNSSGWFTFITEGDPSGFTGRNLDTEIAIFDVAGMLLKEDDDSGTGLYSGIFSLGLDAGNYTLAVAGFNSTFANGFVVNAGRSQGDYRLKVSLVPEPATLALFGLGACGLYCTRRRKLPS